jgi:hypothetical protein
VDVAVHKKLPLEYLPGQALDGNTSRQMSDLCNGTVQLAQNIPQRVPISRALKNIFTQNNQSINCVEQFKVLTRLSFFGNLIVTQFELGLTGRPFLFKDSDGI